jgi:hypothetical protein
MLILDLIKLLPLFLVYLFGKKDMIRQYACLDKTQGGCFGYHPIMDYSRTCYAKVFFYFVLRYICEWFLMSKC